MRNHIIQGFRLSGYLIAGLVCACGAGTATNVDYCSYPTFTETMAESLITNWGAGLQSYYNQYSSDLYMGAGYFTMSYYTPDAILQPTLSQQQLYGTQELYGYFTSFLAKNPIMSTTFESNAALSLGCGYGGYAGYYNFVTYPGTLQESTTEARFTFIYQYEPSAYYESFTAESGTEQGTLFTQQNSAGWYISLQQSSVLPN